MFTTTTGAWEKYFAITRPSQLNLAKISRTGTRVGLQYMH